MASKPPPLFRLPRELRDEIHKLAYVPDDGLVKVFEISNMLFWKRNERRQGKGSSSSISHVEIPECPLYAMLVSKQFYEEASAAYFSSVTFSDEAAYEDILEDFFNLIPTMRPRIIKLYCRYSWQAMGQRSGRPIIPHLPNLRELTMHMEEEVFDSFGNKHSCVHVFNDKDFDYFRDLQELLRIPSLRKLKIEAGQSEMAVSKREEEIWQRNARLLQVYVDEKLRQKGEVVGASIERHEQEWEVRDVTDTDDSPSAQLAALRSQAVSVGEQMTALSKQFAALQENIDKLEAQIET